METLLSPDKLACSIMVGQNSGRKGAGRSQQVQAALLARGRYLLARFALLGHVHLGACRE